MERLEDTRADFERLAKTQRDFGRLEKTLKDWKDIERLRIEGNEGDHENWGHTLLD